MPRTYGRRLAAGVVMAIAIGLAPYAASGLEFAPCSEAGHETFDCATLSVSLDRAGAVPGIVPLSIERLRQDGPPRPVLVALAGGPGQSATSLDAVFARVLAGVLDRYQLVVFDQRGTGRSGVLDCPTRRAGISGGPSACT
jgi:pimeloyl-ACP methyl ester carboxylesterase